MIRTYIIPVTLTFLICLLLAPISGVAILAILLQEPDLFFWGGDVSAIPFSIFSIVVLLPITVPLATVFTMMGLNVFRIYKLTKGVGVPLLYCITGFLGGIILPVLMSIMVILRNIFDDLNFQQHVTNSAFFYESHWLSGSIVGLLTGLFVYKIWCYQVEDRGRTNSCGVGPR